MEECKNCKSTETVKNGLVRQKQRYKCKSCGHNFVYGDERRIKSTELKRITSVLLYSLGKASFRFLAKLFDVSPTTTYNWVRQTAESFGDPPSVKGSASFRITVASFPTSPIQFGWFVTGRLLVKKKLLPAARFPPALSPPIMMRLASKSKILP